MALWKKASDRNKGYLKAADARRISRENARAIRRMELRQDRRDVSPSEYTAVMTDPDNIAEIEHLRAWFFTDIGTIKAVDDVSFAIPRGKTVCIVGESALAEVRLVLAAIRFPLLLFFP